MSCKDKTCSTSYKNVSKKADKGKKRAKRKAGEWAPTFQLFFSLRPTFSLSGTSGKFQSVSSSNSKYMK